MLQAMRRVTAYLILITLALGAGAMPVVAAAAEDCSLAVTPTEGPPGTEFVFTGSGYSPTVLTLKQKGSEARVSQLDLGGADPFEIKLLATEAEAGQWTVIASIPGTECAGRATIDVVLPDTSSATDPTGSQGPDLPMLASLVGLALVFLASGWSIRGRLARRA